MNSQSLLWLITPPSGRPSWLFGTMHIRDERAHQLSTYLYPLILGADAFIGEMDLEMTDVYPEDIRYDAKKFLTERSYLKLQQQLLKSFHIQFGMYAHLHPLMIMSLISNSVLQSERLISLDEHLWNFAKQHGKITSGLESYKEQHRLLHSIDAGPLYRQLQNIGRNPAAVRKNTDRGLKLYIEGRIHELYILSKSSMHNLRKKIIYERNAKMTEVILHLDHSLQYFITVGAGHLSGKTGILSLLKRSGWKVNPVKAINNRQ